MEKRLFTKADNTHLAALYSPKKNARALIIVCHGFSGRKENSGFFAPFAEELNQEGYAALAFDFSGNGESEGNFADITLSRQIDDLKTIFYAMSNETNLPIVLLGRSFGASTVIACGGDKLVQGCILWSAGVFLEDVFRKGLKENYDILKSGEKITEKILQSTIELEPSFIYDIEKHDKKMGSYLDAISGKPVFAIQGSDDFLVAPQSIHLIENHCPNAEIHYIEGADHRFEKMKSFRNKATISFLKKHF